MVTPSSVGYVALNFPTELSHQDFKGKPPPRSLRRWWKSLLRFQQNLIFVIAVGIFFTIFYLAFKSSDSAVINTVKQDGEEFVQEKVFDVLQDPPRGGKDLNVLVTVGDQPDVLEEPKPLSKKAVDASINEGPTNERQKAVVEAFKHAWTGYKRFAWGHDHLKPISKSYHDWFGLGLSIVDCIDTIYIMGLKTTYEEARDWIEKRLSFEGDRDVNLFEVTIRVLGGLLGIYHLTGDQMYLRKAVDLGDRLLPSFYTESGVPYVDVNLFTRKAHSAKWTPDSSTAEVTSLQLEFRDLSRASGNPKYEEAAAKVSSHMHTLEKKDGLVPIFINPHSGQFRYHSTITLGARGDSYYEYLLKQWIQTGRTIDYLRDDYLEAIKGVEKHLIKRTVPNGYLFVGELLGDTNSFKNKMDHLTCFLPGTLALGVHFGMPISHSKLADELARTCYQTYAQQPTFLAPEITYFNIWNKNASDMYVKRNDVHNLLRPEFVETLWYMYQLTKNATYQDWGWEIFQAFEKHTKVTHGYTSINNVHSSDKVMPRDMMESFFLAETLKYLYLLFSDDPELLDVDEYIINTEAHPFPIYNS